jgi:hypothetical protein
MLILLLFLVQSAFADLQVRVILLKHCGSCHDSTISTHSHALQIFDLADEQWIRKLSARELKSIPVNFRMRKHLVPMEKQELGLGRLAPDATDEEIALVTQGLLEESARRLAGSREDR